jgi:hypothetical protein
MSTEQEQSAGRQADSANFERAFERAADALEAAAYDVCGSARQPHMLAHPGARCINCGARMRGDA